MNNSFYEAIQKNTTKEETVIDTSKYQLSVQDLEYLLTILKTTTLRGEQVEHFYNLILKLQNQYLLLTKK